MLPLDFIATFGVAIAPHLPLSGAAKLNARFRGERVAEVDLDFDGRQCRVCLTGFGFAEEVVELLRSTPAMSSRDVYPRVLEDLSGDLRATAESVLLAWKFVIARDEAIPEGALAGASIQWRVSAHDERWERFPSWIGGVASIGQLMSLRHDTAQLLQSALIDDVEPLIGMTYLHRAKAERNPRYRWVDATIAAELCIKEILISVRPEVEVLLNNLPSPPLSKLYGEVLEAYLGEKSPYLKAISKGIEKRNLLVHRPAKAAVSSMDAHEYVMTIEKAIFHAWNLALGGKSYLAPMDLCRPMVIADF